jgi:hypothetical protein
LKKLVLQLYQDELLNLLIHLYLSSLAQHSFVIQIMHIHIAPIQINSITGKKNVINFHIILPVGEHKENAEGVPGGGSSGPDLNSTPLAKYFKIPIMEIDF